MRNGLLLTAVVLTLALLPAASFASAPIFQRVPAVVCLADSGTTASGTVVADLDAAVYDPDNSDDELAWSFVEYAGGLNVVDVDGAGATNLFMTDQGVLAVASTDDGRVVTTGSASNIARDTNAFVLVVDQGSTGVATDVAAAYASTTHANTAADDLYTTIIVVVTDGVNHTYKTVLVKADYTSGSELTEGAYENLLTLTGANGSGLTFGEDAQVQAGVITGSSDGSGVTLNVAQNAVTFDANGIYAGYAYWLGDDGVLIDGGYVYRLTANIVQNPGDGTIGSGLGVQMKLQQSLLNQGYGIPLTQFFQANNRGTGGANAKQPFSIDATNGYDYEILFEPPVRADLDGLTYNTTEPLRWFLEVVATNPASYGSNTYTNFAVDRFPAPEHGSNGLLYLADTVDDFTSSGTQPLAYANDVATPGWKFAAREVTAVTLNPFNLVTVFHTDQSQYYGAGATTVSDAITTVRWSTSYPGAIEIVHGVDALVYNALNIGGDNATVDATEQSVIPVALVEENGDDVYYRATYQLRSASGQDTTDMPITNCKVGGSLSTYTGILQIGAGGIAQPVSSAYTPYRTWVRGYPAIESTLTVFNNLTLEIETFDANPATGGTVVLGEASLEMFPVAFFE